MTVKTLAKWDVRSYESGTMLVTRLLKGAPWFHVFGPGGTDDGDCLKNRFEVCQQLADFLNGGRRPEWLNDLERRDERHAEALDRTSITAVGPQFDADPPNLDWREDQSNEARDARRRLMDLLCVSAKGAK